jgi:hypothetical protein
MMASIVERLQESAKWKIMRFNSAEHYLQFKRYLEEGISEEALFGMECRPYSLSRFFGNVLLEEGIAELHALICGAGAVKWDNTNAYLGVGDDNTAPAPAQTGLIGTDQYKGMEATYPTFASEVTTWRAEYASGEANFAWEEYSVSNTSGGDTGENLNRATSSEGTKQSGQVWTLDLAITWS